MSRVLVLLVVLAGSVAGRAAGFDRLDVRGPGRLLGSPIFLTPS